MAVLVQDNNSPVDGSPLIHGSGIVVVEIVNEMGVNILHSTHDIALALGIETKVLTDTASDADTLLVAIINIQCTVAGRLIGVEIALHQEARSTMFQDAQITGVSDTGIGIDAC